MSDKIIARDAGSGLTLTESAHDPPRYYLRLRGRRDLVSIGNLAAAIDVFVRQTQRLQQCRQRAQAAVDGARGAMAPLMPPPASRMETAKRGSTAAAPSPGRASGRPKTPPRHWRP
jgi:hypothetical protein